MLSTQYLHFHGLGWIAFVALWCFVWIVGVLLYRLYFHPYSKVPGPLLARVSSLYSAYHSWRGTMHLDVQRCHRLYGDLIRYAPNQILSLHAADMTAIYGYGKPFRKARGYGTMPPISDAWSSVTSIDRSLHHNLRRTFRSGVSTEHLSTFEPVIVQNLDIYFEELTKAKDVDGWSKTADMRCWNLCLGFDTMAAFGLGLKTNLLRNQERDFVIPVLHSHVKKLGFWEQVPIFNDVGISTIVGVLYLAVSPNARKFFKWYRNFLAQGIANNSTKISGFLGPVIQSGLGLLEKPGHNRRQMTGESIFTIFSSSDAYAVLMCGFTHYLSQYPGVYDTLATELRAKYKPGDKIVWGPALEANKYLRAVVDELLRLLPAASGVHWRECERPGVTVGPDGYPVSVGSDVGMSLFSLFRDGRIFRDPVKFWPERWIQGTLPEAEMSAARRAFTPFLIGPRNCAGGHVSLMVACVSFTHLVVNYDFRRCAGQEFPFKHSNPRFQTTGEIGAEKELVFESHYSLASWEKGPFIQFKKREAAIESL